MKTNSDRTGLMFIGAAAVWILFATQARADGIEIEALFAAGAMVLIPLTAFVVLVEAAILSAGFRASYKDMLLVALSANVLSLLAGMPVKILNSSLYSVILPHPLAPYVRVYPWAVTLGTLIYFVVTVVVEYWFIARWRRNRRSDIPRLRVAKVVLLANVATYAVLAPMHYIATRPHLNEFKFTDDSSWARRPPVRLFYVDQNERLCSILIDGTDARVIIPEVVRDYQYMPGAGVFLYRNGRNELCYFNESRKKSVTCCKPGRQLYMEDAACSSDGKTVAYYEGDTYDPMLFDAESGQALHTGAAMGHALVYGRFCKEGIWSSGRDWGAQLEHDKIAGMEAKVFPGLGTHLEVSSDGKTIVLADNPGLLKFPHRAFRETGFANERELVFCDNEDIYLMDVQNRKVGRIVQGQKFMLLTDRYRR